jgi:hypothetical protein
MFDPIEDSLQQHPVASPVLMVCCKSIYNRKAHRVLLFSLAVLDYNSFRLVKRSRALRGRNPTRNSQVRAGK